MRTLSTFLSSVSLILLAGCSAVTLPVTNEYQLSAYSGKQFSARPKNISLLVTTPEAVAGYQTDAMLYVKKAFQLEPFAKNSWTSPPADMLYPLLIQSLQRTGYFHAIATSPYSEKADYRLDTQLIELKQNFLKKPSTIDFSAKIVLTHIEENKVLASRIINLNIPCPSDSPYGGVVAANQASYRFTEAVTRFVLSHLKRD